MKHFFIALLFAAFSFQVSALDSYQNADDTSTSANDGTVNTGQIPLLSPNDPDPTSSYEEQREKLIGILPADSPDPATQTVEEQTLRIQGAQKLFDDSDEDACCALLCLMSPTQPSECTKCVAKYFSIIVKKHGDFSASRTAQKRLAFLQQCKTGDNSSSKTNSKFGGVKHNPF